MAEEIRQDQEEVGSAAHLMMAAVDKAGKDLEATVRSSTEYLQAFNKTLEHNFVQQLLRIVENAQNMADKGIGELQARKENFVERLAELEESEIDTLVRVGKEIREELELSLRKAVSELSSLVEEQVDTLRPMAMDQHENFSMQISEKLQTINNLAEECRLNMANADNMAINMLSQQMQEFESAAVRLLKENQQNYLGRMQANSKLLEEKVENVKTELDKDFERDRAELEEKIKEGSDLVASVGQKTVKSLGDQIEHWQSETRQILTGFKENLAAERQSFDGIHKTKIEQQLEEVKGEIQIIGHQACERLAASHKLFQGSLRRLEKKYEEKLERLLQSFEAATAQESRVRVRPDMSIETRRELKELLNTRLKARGLEMVKAFKRQIELYDLEHARFAASCTDRIESVNAASKDSLEQQLKTASAEVERLMRAFRTELAQLDLQISQIKDAGHAAALAVLAYKRARFSFGTD